MASSSKDKYFFLKKLQIIHVVSSECLLVNKKNDVKNGSKWKPINSWIYQQFVKML